MKFSYAGLAGFHPHVVAAALADPDFLRRRYEQEVDVQQEALIDAERVVPRYVALTLCEAADIDSVVGDYAEWLLDHNGKDHDEIMWDCDLERAFAEAQIDFESFAEQFQVGPTDPTFEGLKAALEKEYPPEEVWEEAMGVGISLEQVAFCCPHCGNPVALAFDGTGFSPDAGWYCGVCGTETTFESNHVEALVDLGVEWWPFHEHAPYDLVHVALGDDNGDEGVDALLREGLNVYPLGEGEALIPVNQVPRAIGIRPDIATASATGTLADPPASVAFTRGYVPPMPNTYDPPAVNPSAEGGTLSFPAAMLDYSIGEDQQAGIFLGDADLRKLHATLTAYLQKTGASNNGD